MKRKYTITNKQVEQIKKSYGNLIYAISYRIGGDAVTNSFDDSVQDLYMAAMDACEVYGEKTGKDFEEFFGTEEFGKYIKSTLWNKKNNTGKKITQKKNINQHFSLDEKLMGDETMLQETDTSSLKFDVDFDREGQELVNLILGDYSLIKPSGSVNLSRASRELGIDKKELKSRIERIKNTLSDYHD